MEEYCNIKPKHDFKRVNVVYYEGGWIKEIYICSICGKVINEWIKGVRS